MGYKRGSKLAGYNIFKTVVLMVKDKKHLTLEGVIQILNLSYFMNKDTSLRTEESKGVLVDKLIKKYEELLAVSPIPKANPLEIIPFEAEQWKDVFKPCWLSIKLEIVTRYNFLIDRNIILDLFVFLQCTALNINILT